MQNHLGGGYLRSITRAGVNKNDGDRKIEFLTLFWDSQKLSFVFAPPGITFCALSPDPFWDYVGIILG